MHTIQQWILFRHSLLVVFTLTSRRKLHLRGTEWPSGIRRRLRRAPSPVRTRPRAALSLRTIHGVWSEKPPSPPYGHDTYLRVPTRKFCLNPKTCFPLPFQNNPTVPTYTQWPMLPRDNKIK